MVRVLHFAPVSAQQTFHSRFPLFRAAIHKVLPVHAYAPLRFELRLALLRLRTRRAPRQYAGARDLLVNIGAGPHGRPGWVNVDASPGPNIQCLYDCRRRLPFPDGSARGIFTEHFLEHLDYAEEAPLFLAECRRILRPGGVLRVVVPDAELYLRAYAAGGWSELARIRPLGPGNHDPHLGVTYRTRLELVNAVFRQGFEHRYAYDCETLARLLSDAGFGVKRQSYGVSVMPDLAIDQALRASESLYIDAVKAS